MRRAQCRWPSLGSIGLYLNVLNIFLIILNLLGFVSND